MVRGFQKTNKNTLMVQKITLRFKTKSYILLKETLLYLKKVGAI